MRSPAGAAWPGSNVWRRAWIVARAGLATIGLLVLLVSFTPLTGWWLRALAGPWTDAPGDVLIVPGAEALPEGVVGPGTYWRTVYAGRIWRAGGVREIVVSGADPVASSMALLLESMGVARDAIVTENRSTSTRENALNTASLLASTPGRKVLVTSDYHMFRAIRVFRRAGVDVQPRPIPDLMKMDGRWYYRWQVFLMLAVETGKIAYYEARGWM